MTPRIVIELPIEGAPIIRTVADTEGEETRLADWICNSPGSEAVLTVAQRALQQFIDERRAAEQ